MDHELIAHRLVNELMLVSVLVAGEGRSVAEGLDYVATWNAAFLSSDDLVEAMSAFIEKRPGSFTGT